MATVSEQSLLITVNLTGVPESQCELIVTAVNTAIQGILTAHGVGGTLTTGAVYSESLAP